MKRKMIVIGLLVVVCLGVLVVEGVSQPVPPPSVEPAAAPGATTFPLSPASPPPSPVSVKEPQPNFAVVKPQQQELTFEQLVGVLKGVRARQKELQKQEADLLAELERKVEEKRQDLSKSESILQQLRVNGRVHPVKRIEDKMDTK